MIVAVDTPQQHNSLISASACRPVLVEGQWFRDRLLAPQTVLKVEFFPQTPLDRQHGSLHELHFSVLVHICPLE